MTLVAGARFLLQTMFFRFSPETIANARGEIIRAVKSCDDQDVYIRHTH